MSASNDFSLASLIKAMNFAAVKHQTQRRKDAAQTPYINHPIGVANILTSEGMASVKYVIAYNVEKIRSEFESLWNLEVATIAADLNHVTSRFLHASKMFKEGSPIQSSSRPHSFTTQWRTRTLPLMRFRNILVTMLEGMAGILLL